MLPRNEKSKSKMKNPAPVETLVDPQEQACMGSASHVVRAFSDVLVAFLYFDICHYSQSNLAIENPEFS